MKRIVIFFAILISAVLACDSGNEKDFMLNNDGTDIIVNAENIYIALRINDDLYVLRSSNGKTWLSQLIRTNLPIYNLWFRRVFASYEDKIKLCFIDKNRKAITYYNDVKAINNYDIITYYDGEDYYHDLVFSTNISKNFTLFFQESDFLAKLFIENNSRWDSIPFPLTGKLIEIIGVENDPDGNEHIFILVGSSPTNLIHYYRKGDHWEFEKIGHDVYYYADFSIDNRGIIYLIYDEYLEDSPHKSSQTHYLMKTVGGWIEADFADEVRKLHNFGGPNGIIATDEGILHFFGSNRDYLYYLSNKNGTWEKTEIAQSYSDNFGSFSFTVDDQNNAHIVYCDSEDDEDPSATKLYYVTDKTGEWVRHEVDFTP